MGGDEEQRLAPLVLGKPANGLGDPSALQLGEAVYVVPVQDGMEGDLIAEGGGSPGHVLHRAQRGLVGGEHDPHHLVDAIGTERGCRGLDAWLGVLRSEAHVEASGSESLKLGGHARHLGRSALGER